MAALLIAALPALADQSEPRSANTGIRLMPPESLECDRNHLTSYQGTVTAIDISEAGIQLTIETDWGSKETFSLAESSATDIESRMLWNGQAFTKENWPALQPEQKIYAIAWVCEDGVTPTVIDWRPAPSP